MKSPLRGAIISSVFAQGERLRHELYIDTGDGERNLEIFEHLRGQQEQFESSYGRPVDWEELPQRRACRVADYRENSSVADEAQHGEFVDWFLDASVRLRRALAALGPPA